MKKVLSLLIVLTMVSALVLNVFAWKQVSTLTDDELEEAYSDHFGDDHKASDWLMAGGTKVENGVMTLGLPFGNWTSTGYMAFLKGSAVDYKHPHVIEFKATVAEGGSCYTGFGLRANGYDGGAFPNLMNGGRWGMPTLTETASGIAVDLKVGAVDGVTGLSFQNGDSQGTSALYLVPNPEGLNVHTENTYKIADDGDKITVWVNGGLFFSIEMSNLVDGWYKTVVVKNHSGAVIAKGAGDREAVVAESGMVGFYQRDKGITVDDLVVKVEKKPEYKMVNAAFDELKYDDTALVSEKAYTWVHDEANRPAMDFEKDSVSVISFKGWARTTMSVAGFGYRVDGGELVTGDFILDRAAELEQAGETGAQGYLVTVPADQFMLGEHTIGIYVLDEYGRDIQVVKTKNGVDYPIEITFTVAPSSVVPTEPVNSNHNIDNKKCNNDMTEFNVYGWSVYNMPVKALGYKLDGGEPVWVVTDVAEEPREGDAGRAANDIFRDSLLDPALVSGNLTGGLDPFWAYRINLTLDISGLEVGTEHTLEVVVKFTNDAETVLNAFEEETFTFTKTVPNKITLKKDGETSKIDIGALSAQSVSMDGDITVFTTTKAGDPWFEIPLPQIDTNVYIGFRIKYRAQSVHGNNVYLKDTEVNKGYSGVVGTWAPPGLTADNEWHEKVYMIAETFPKMAGTLLTGIRIPGATAAGEKIELEYIELIKEAAPVEPSLGNMSVDSVALDGVELCNGDALTFIKNNPISFKEGEVSKISSRGWAQMLNGTISAFGYKLDDGELVSGSQFIQNRPDLASIPGAAGFNNFDADVSALKAGQHKFTVYMITGETEIKVFDVPFTVEPSFVKPETQEEIVNALYELADNETLPEGPYTLTGVITEVNTAYSERYGNVTVTIVVGGLTDKPVLCYRIKGDGADVIDVGYTVTVRGELVHFVNANNNAYEFKQDSVIVSYEAPVLLGDVNGDGSVNNKDVMALFQFVSESLDEGATFIEANADINGDGSINNKDVMALFKLISEG